MILKQINYFLKFQCFYILKHVTLMFYSLPFVCMIQIKNLLVNDVYFYQKQTKQTNV